QSGKDGVELLVWSGNVELDYWYTSTDGPGNYQFDIQGAKQNQANTKFLGARSVRGVGEQATEIFQTMVGNSPAVTLYVLSGQASLQVTSSDVGISAPLSRARKLAADIAMARDVL